MIIWLPVWNLCIQKSLCLYVYTHTFTQENGMVGLKGCNATKRTVVRICNWGETLSKFVCLFQRSVWGKSHLKWQQQCRLWNLFYCCLYFKGVFVVWCSYVWIYRSLKWKVCFTLKLKLFFSRDLLGEGKQRRWLGLLLPVIRMSQHGAQSCAVYCSHATSFPLHLGTLYLCILILLCWY